MKLYMVIIVLSFPPCGVEVEVNAEPTLPTSLPWNQSPPKLSTNAFNSELTFPKRVGVPNTIASARPPLMALDTARSCVVHFRASRLLWP